MLIGGLTWLCCPNSDSGFGWELTVEEVPNSNDEPEPRASEVGKGEDV